jgi:hypothetical protein
MANKLKLVTMSVPTTLVNEVNRLTMLEQARLHPKPIKRVSRVTPADVKAYKTAQRTVNKLNNKLWNEYDRLDSLLDHPRSKADEQWLQKRRDYLDDLLHDD